jgi:TonB family protein
VHAPAVVPSLKLPRRRAGPGGFVLALLLHAALLAFVILPWMRDLERFERAFGPVGGELGGGGGGGGGPVREVALPAFTPPPPPAPVAEAEVPLVEPEPVPEVVPTAVAPRDSQPVAVAAAGTPPGAAGEGPGSGGGTGGGVGGGVGPGVGPGSGPGTGGGDGGRARPPQLRHLAILPDGAPDAIKGRTVRVTFFVEPDGSVRAIEVTPPLEDRGYARKVEERLESYRFRPALGPDGTPIAGRVSITFDLPTR